MASPQPTVFEWLQGFLFIVMLLLAVLLVLRHMVEARRLAQQAQVKRKIFTVVDCGEKTLKREYREGDYVGMLAKGECEGNDGLVVAVYAVEPKTEEKKKGFLP